MRVQRFDDPNLDLTAHAREVVRGGVELSPAARAEMIHAIGIKPSPGAADAIVARAYLAARGARP